MVLVGEKRKKVFLVVLMDCDGAHFLCVGSHSVARVEAESPACDCSW